MITILNLKDTPQHLEILARWHHNEWSNFNPGEKLQQRIERMQAYLGSTFVPSTYVATNKILLGSAAIVDNDMDTRPDLSPWLASVYVNPKFRYTGVGTKLVQHVMAEAKTHCINKLYLFTPDQQGFYEKLGWSTIDRTRYRDQQVSVMQVNLSD